MKAAEKWVGQMKKL